MELLFFEIKFVIMREHSCIEFFRNNMDVVKDAHVR